MIFKKNLEIIKFYNMIKGGVDVVDQFKSYIYSI